MQRICMFCGSSHGARPEYGVSAWPVALRQQFSKVLKTSPARYRREFRGSRV